MQTDPKKTIKRIRLIKLINIIKNVHSLKLQNIDNAEAQYIAMQRYITIKMLSNISLTDYKAAFVQAVQDLTVLQHSNIPTEAFQARHYIVRLDKDRYNQFQVACINTARSGGQLPNTVQNAHDVHPLHRSNCLSPWYSLPRSLVNATIVTRWDTWLNTVA